MHFILKKTIFQEAALLNTELNTPWKTETGYCAAPLNVRPGKQKWILIDRVNLFLINVLFKYPFFSFA